MYPQHTDAHKTDAVSNAFQPNRNTVRSLIFTSTTSLPLKIRDTKPRLRFLPTVKPPVDFLPATLGDVLMVDEGVRLALLVESSADEEFSVFAEPLYPLAHRPGGDVHHLSDFAAVPHRVDTLLNSAGKDIKDGNDECFTQEEYPSSLRRYNTPKRVCNNYTTHPCAGTHTVFIRSKHGKGLQKRHRDDQQNTTPPHTTRRPPRRATTHVCSTSRISGQGRSQRAESSSASSRHTALLGRFHLLEDSVRPNRQGSTDDGRETRFLQHFRRVLHDTPVAVGLPRLYGGVHTN